VQLGDVVDRGPDSLKIIRHLMKLQREAPRKGGRVIVLVGNHEAMTALGNEAYCTIEEYLAERAGAWVTGIQGGIFLLALGAGFASIWLIGSLFRLRENHWWPLIR